MCTFSSLYQNIDQYEMNSKQLLSYYCYFCFVLREVYELRLLVITFLIIKFYKTCASLPSREKNADSMSRRQEKSGMQRCDVAGVASSIICGMFCSTMEQRELRHRVRHQKITIRPLELCFLFNQWYKWALVAHYDTGQFDGLAWSRRTHISIDRS